MGGDSDRIFSYPMFRDLEREQTVFTGIAGHRSFGANLAHGGQTTSSQGMLVSGSYFPVLGLQPALGRLFTPDDDRTPGAHPVVVLSHDHWRVRFDASPAILNDSLIVNGRAMTVVGVAPAGFHGTTLGELPDVFVPLTMSETMRGHQGLDSRRYYWVYLFARLAPGVSIEAASTGINVPYVAIITDLELALQQGSSDRTLERFAAKQIGLEPGSRGHSNLQQEAGAPLFLLLRVTGVVLLIACVNIANLLLARTAERSGEMAVRLSMGATRGQLIRQLLAESWLLAGVGGLGGLLVANWTLVLIARMLPPEATAIIGFRLDASMLLFTGGLVLATGLVFGLLPAWQSVETRPGLDAERTDGKVVGHPNLGAVPDRAGDRPDRVVDGVARHGGSLHAQPGQRQPGRAGYPCRQPGDLPGVAAAERLYDRAIFGALRTDGGPAGRGAGCGRCHRLDRPGAGREQPRSQRVGPGV
jgi:predicted permease